MRPSICIGCAVTGFAIGAWLMPGKDAFAVAMIALAAGFWSGNLMRGIEDFWGMR